MSGQDCVTVWLNQLKEGEYAGVQNLMELYFQRLVQLAAARLRGRPTLEGYDEDVALSAFKSLCLGAARGQFPRLDNRDDFWRLLAVITVRKSIDLTRRKASQMHSSPEDVDFFLSREPTPDMAAEVADEIQRLLESLDDPDMRQIALWKVEGYSNEEIARRLGCVERTVERKLHRIRLIWDPPQ